MKQIILLGACMMALGVVLGAFGAHEKKRKFQPICWRPIKPVWNTTSIMPWA